MSVRETRIRNEWRLLESLRDLNSDILEVVDRFVDGDGDAARLVVRMTTGILGVRQGISVAREHAAVVRFPRFFPSVPIEAQLTVPVFHPNIDPHSGFVCLWTRFSVGDTLMEAIVRLQQIIAWKLVNPEAHHVMQPEALRWYQDPGRNMELPLEHVQLRLLESFLLERTDGRGPAGRRKRRLFDSDGPA